MWLSTVEWSLIALGAYAAIGLVFGLFFVARLVERIDTQARGSTFGFRVLIFPGSVVLWPWLAKRVWSAQPDREPTERSPHRDLAGRGDA
jgi:hypothetical protein